MALLTDQLLADASTLLADQGFALRVADLSSGRPWLLAENENFLIGVLVSDEVSTLLDEEPLAAAALAELVRLGQAQSKQWDVYLVLLATGQPQTSEDERGLAELQYNLRALRRLVGAGVRDADQMTHALASFLPLRKPAADLELAALEALAEELVVNGVDPGVVARYIDVFRQQGSLDGA
jgi:hypothetical protein